MLAGAVDSDSACLDFPDMAATFAKLEQSMTLRPYSATVLALGGVMLNKSGTLLHYNSTAFAA